MAKDVLFNIVEDLLKNLASRAVQEIAAAWGFKGQLEKFKDSANKIKGVLSDAEQRQEGNEAVWLWLERLRYVVYDADDLFDEFSTMVMRKELMFGWTLSKELHLFFSKSNQAAFACKMSRQVKKIRGKLDDIAKYGDRFAFRNDIGQALSSVRRETHSFVRADEVIGRDEDRKAILEMLMLDPLLGKTYLFPQMLVWGIMEDYFSSDYKKSEHVEIDRLKSQLRRLIDGKKYLLVLDDVWNENLNKWHELRILLMGENIGSKILLTTRSSVVAQIVGTTYDLKELSEEMHTLEEIHDLTKNLRFGIPDVLDHLNGVFLLGPTPSLVLPNTSIQKFLELPFSDLVWPSHVGGYSKFALDFDSHSNDNKVVTITSCTCAIYSLNAGSWRHIHGVRDEHANYFHWLSSTIFWKWLFIGL
ncbi:hypothetical protein Dimus_017112 [Dionaea muscipula]